MNTTHIEMSEGTRSKENIKTSELRYRRLFETAKDGILLLDAVTGEITDVNPFLIELLGYSLEELINKELWEISPFKDAVANKVAFQELRQKKYIRYEELPLKSKSGNRVEVEFVSNLYEVNGQEVIQCNIRDISERKLAKDRLHKANEVLSVLVAKLQKHDLEMKMVNRMNDLLQACKTKEEAYQVIGLAVGEIFPGQCGGMAILHDSGNYLETFAQWGDEQLMKPIFSLDDCWAMRRGKQHVVQDPKTSIVCTHFSQSPEKGYICLPLVVQGETLGLLTIFLPTGMKREHEISWRQLFLKVGEGIKLSLSNIKLRELMRDQATHDPLTGLFNRRYLSDTLSRELNHARRRNAKTCIVMLDIDHFKRFNDTYGHEAGDLMLRELGRVLKGNIRKSDIACRFGGEEFVLVLLDTSIEDCFKYLEKLVEKVKAQQVRFGEQLLGTMTLSIGVVEASEYVMDAEELQGAADKAMYAAKHAGRDCIILYRDLEKMSA
ncbi:MAG: diguanylate cyclase [Anaerolineaceae bacterium]|nr:diguanylate cyclase [Anaerolineaceae bacterium]